MTIRKQYTPYDTPTKNYRLITAFINGFLDKRKLPYQKLRALDTLCREAIEKQLSENAEIKALIRQSYPQKAETSQRVESSHGIPLQESPQEDHSQEIWIRELIVNYTLLKMQQHALLWEIDAHKPQQQERPHD